MITNDNNDNAKKRQQKCKNIRCTKKLTKI